MKATRGVLAGAVAVLAALASFARAELQLQEKVRGLPANSPQGPFVRGADGAIWGVDPAGALVSRDEGRTWEARKFLDAEKFQASGERALLRTRDGVMVYAFLNRKEMALKWDDAKGGPQEGCRLPVYTMRSADDGKTWSAPALLQDGWCGAVRQMIQLRSGRVLLVCQQAAANPGRHVTILYFSDDAGASWRASDRIDGGAAGNYAGSGGAVPAGTHGGMIEGTVLEKMNGELTLLLRTPHGCFYQSTSKDGAKWTAPAPSTVEASDSPGTMTRLASGRVALVWNRYRDPAKRLARREELSIAFSENDGLTWTTPQVFAFNPAEPGKRESASWISYPYLFEAAPGRIWISTMQGPVRVELAEKDFLAPVANPLGRAAVRMIALGDSITKGSRPGVMPQQAFPALVQAALRARNVRVDVHNTGIGGERTDQALARLERDVIWQRPHIVTIMYGTNDGWVDEGKAESRLAVAAYAENLRQIVRRLRAAGIVPVLMTEPKFGEDNRRNGLGEDPNLRLIRYVAACRAVARELAVPLVDHFAGWEQAQREGRRLQAWTTDGTHPNTEGHADLAARIAGIVTPIALSVAEKL